MLGPYTAGYVLEEDDGAGKAPTYLPTTLVCNHFIILTMLMIYNLGTSPHINLGTLTRLLS